MGVAGLAALTNPPLIPTSCTPSPAERCDVHGEARPGPTRSNRGPEEKAAVVVFYDQYHSPLLSGTHSIITGSIVIEGQNFL